MTFRFLHAADIHLDSPLRGLSRYEGAPAGRIRMATREAFDGLVQHAIQAEVDFVVIAGDLYDGTQLDINTGLYFCSQMGRLDRAGIPAFVVHGNHDAESQITKRLPLPKNVHVFSAKKAETRRIDSVGVVLHGRSYPQSATTDNLVPHYPEPAPGQFNIGVLHTALEGYAAHANYAPCKVDELAARGYDYWALGHVHEHEVKREEPWVVFPGNLQGRHIREAGPRGAVLVSCENNRVVSAERLHFDVVRWHHLRIDATAATTWTDLTSEVELQLRSLVAASDGRLNAVRITFEGRTAVHARLASSTTLRAEMAAIASAIDPESIWIEKIVRSTRPVLDADAIAARADAVADLQLMLVDAPGDDDLVRELEREIAVLVASLPAGFREFSDDSPLVALAQKGDVREIITAIAPDLMQRLLLREQA